MRTYRSSPVHRFNSVFSLTTVAALVSVGLFALDAYVRTIAPERRPSPVANLDPLTNDEIADATKLALADIAASTSYALPNQPDVDGRYGQLQYVGAERHIQKAPTTGRVADVTFYDYRTDDTQVVVVNISSGKTISAWKRSGIQPPPTRGEARQAVRHILADHVLGKQLRSTYEYDNGAPLTSPDQLHIRASVFRSEQAAEMRNREQFAGCGVRRCLQVIIRMPSGRWVDTSRIVVDMSNEHVLMG